MTSKPKARERFGELTARERFEELTARERFEELKKTTGKESLYSHVQVKFLISLVEAAVKTAVAVGHDEADTQYVWKEIDQRMAEGEGKEGRPAPAS